MNKIGFETLGTQGNFGDLGVGWEPSAALRDSLGRRVWMNARLGQLAVEELQDGRLVPLPEGEAETLLAALKGGTRQ